MVKVFPSGVFSVNAEVDGSLMIVPIETMRELLDYNEEVSAVEIRISPQAGTAGLSKIKRGLAERLGPGFRVRDRFEQNTALYKMMSYEKAAIFLILVFVIFIIAFSIFGSLSMLIIEKQGDIQTLRSMGATSRLINRIFIIEGWLISVLGLVAGLVIGFGLLWLIRWFGGKVFHREAMGMGDVFLMGAVGALFGPVAVIVTLILSSVFGSVVGVGMVLLSRARLGKFVAIPYGPYICLGCLAWMFRGPEMVEWYLHLVK